MTTLTEDWTPGGGSIEQHELPDEGTYEAVICEVPRYYRDVTWEGVTTRKAQTQIVHEIDAVDKDGNRFLVTTKPGSPTLSKQSNLYKYITKLGLSASDAKTKINALLVGRGVKVTIEHSEPVGDAGIVYTRFLSHKASDNGMTVSENYVPHKDRFPESMIQNPEAKDTGATDDSDPFGL